MLKYPVTTATRFLSNKNINYTPHLYNYESKGGTKQTSIELSVNEYNVIKTLVFQIDNKTIILVLMHGTLEVSTKELARILNVKNISQCTEETAKKATGYQFGGTSPFGTKKELPIYVEKTIFDLDKMYINGGKRGFILEMTPDNLLKIFPNLKLVEVGITK